MPVINNKAVGKRIKEIRINSFENKLTLEQFGKRLSPPAIRPLVSKWEKGLNLPNEERLKQISKLGNVSTDYLLFGKQLSGYGERIRIIREVQLKLEQNEFARIFRDPTISADTVAAWEEENLLPTREQLEMISSMGDSTIEEIVWNKKNSNSVNIIKESDSQLEKLNLSDENKFMSEVILDRFVAIRKIVAKDIETSKIIRDILDSILAGLEVNVDTTEENKQQLTNLILTEYKSLLERQSDTK